MASFTCHCPCSQYSPALSRDGPGLGSFSQGRRSAAFKQLPLQAGKVQPPARLSLSCHASSKGSPQAEQEENSSVMHRREAIAMGLAAMLSTAVSSMAANADSAGATDLVQAEPTTATAVQVDEINAYSYLYSTAAATDPAPIQLKWVESRKPERYSSAAPLAPDARQRIVSERIDFKNNVVVSVSVGPPNFTLLKSTETTDWDAKDVAQSVLADKSTSRLTTGQRVAEISILNSHTEEKDGTRYWYYEYLTQKSPTVTQKGLDVYRHSVAVTAEREGYLYSLNASTLDSSWEKFSPALKQTVSSFQMLPVTDEYVPPYKDPWRFW
ncbi:hypothetical protein R1flu_017956 [Riccia fluitans]|uniref:PsbP C-terminal domain-containing protein n=1 Tax=Riccia fluitans TaxID=41844 RepID=A0ABD1ZEH7_9MARC